MKTLRGWLIGASLVLISSAAVAQTYTETCTHQILKGARPIYDTNCTEIYTPAPPPPYQPYSYSQPTPYHPPAQSAIVHFVPQTSTGAAIEHRPGCNFDNTICE